jgi:predicted ArsR family transcriptional regulator
MSGPLHASDGVRAVSDRHGVTTTRDHILRILSRGGAWSSDELQALLGVSGWTVSRQLTRLFQAGVIEKVPGVMSPTGRFFLIRWAMVGGGDSDDV